MNINHTIMSGNLTRDPEMRTVGSDRTVTSFTFAHNSRFKTADGEQREEVAFIDCEAWGRQGEIAAQFLIKGSMVIVEGRIKQDNWTDKEGQKRSKLKLVAERVHLTPKREDGSRDDISSDAQEAPTEAPNRNAAPRPPTRPGPTSPSTNRPAARPAPTPAQSTSGFTEQPPF